MALFAYPQPSFVQQEERRSVYLGRAFCSVCPQLPLNTARGMRSWKGSLRPAANTDACTCHREPCATIRIEKEDGCF
jgi:hypothetical protein